MITYLTRLVLCHQGYRPCAQRASILFFVLNDMGKIDPMYQFSLDAYIDLFNNSIEKSQRSPNLEIRIQNLNDYHTYAVYKYVSKQNLVLLVHLVSWKGGVDHFTSLRIPPPRHPWLPSFKPQIIFKLVTLLTMHCSEFGVSQKSALDGIDLLKTVIVNCAPARNLLVPPL